MKKILKITGIIVGVLILLLLLAPFLFKGSLEDLLKKNINENLSATVTWDNLDISFIKSFPKAAVVLEDFAVVNQAPFEGDTLASGTRLELDMGITQLFKSEKESIAVDQLILDEAKVRIKVDSLGRANYDIAKKSTSETASDGSETTSEGFTFNLTHYEINNSEIQYLDVSSETYLTLTELFHEGNGDLGADLSELNTHTQAKTRFVLGDIAYLNDHELTLDADFQLDLKNQKYTFLKNEAKINELPLVFDGFIQLLEDGTQMDLTFETPSSDFKNFLAIIPKKYVTNLNGVETTGDFTVKGAINGLTNDLYIPKMDIAVKSNNASFKYPNLPKRVENISLDAQLKNETGLAQHTYLKIGAITFKVDDELFNASGSLLNLTGNMLVDLALKGTLNLANVEKVFPIDLDQPLTGIFKADVTTQFDMASIEQEQYDLIKTNGVASIKDFNYTDPTFAHPINIAEADVAMAPGNIKLNKLTATSGKTDIAATGNIQNLIPWVMAKQDLKGRFQVTSNTFNVNDFMTSEEATANTTGSGGSENTTASATKLPDFLDATLDFTTKTLLYDDLVLDNAKGTVSIKDEAANLSNVTSSMLGGQVGLNGSVSTKEEIPTFNMQLDLQQIDIDQSFGKLNLLKYLAPIAKALDGNLNTKLSLSGSLNNDLTPNLKTIAGTALAQILTAEVNPQQTPLLSKLGEQVTFLNMDKLSLQDVSTVLDFSDGKISVKPFDFKVDDIVITASGGHSLDEQLNYNLSMEVPGHYLGGDVSKLLAKLDPQEAANTKVTIPVGLKGNFLKPTVAIDTKAAVTSLTQRLIEKQKQDLTDKGTDILKDILGGGNVASDSTNTKTNTTKDQTTEVVKDIFGGIFGKKKKKKDTTKTGN